MAKRSGNKNNSKHFNSIKMCDNKALSVVDDNVLSMLSITGNKLDDKDGQRIGLVKSESAPLLVDHKGYECIDNIPEPLDVINEKANRVPKKPVKVIDEMDEIVTSSALRLSHFVIVDSVLKETNINSQIEAKLPASLSSIYQKFINSKRYIESFQAKDEFYRGVGLFGIGVEERIYNKRKVLEESLKRGFRLRPNPKPRRQFDGTIINRPIKNRNKLNFIKPNGEKIKYNVFNIGNDFLNKSHRCSLRKNIKKKSVMRRAAAQKLELAKKALNEACISSGDDTAGGDHKVSIALSRTKRQPKVPQLDFKYCYSEGFGVRARKNVDKEEQFMEIVDSDSSSVIEVFPPADKENSEYSDGCISHRRVTNQVLNPSKVIVGHRKGWRPQENKALNLLDKLRLGLQCTVIQTERDVIIQNLTLEDLSTLRSRLQGLATFKNIEAEYDKNGQETARATIDRRVLNLPFKGYDAQIDSRLSCSTNKKCDDSLKRKLNSSNDKKKQLTPVKDVNSTNVNVEDFCSTWVRPKVRSVKKIRKLYTQSASTPNILARSQGSTRQEGLSQISNRSSSRKSQSVLPDSGNNVQHSIVPAVSFYPQITTVSANITTEPSNDNKISKPEQFPVVSSSEEPSTSVETITTSLQSLTRNVTATSYQSLSEGSKKVIASNVTSVSSTGTPATAMSASQLLMLRKGGGQTTSDSGTSINSSITMSGNDQLFTNQILKPFKKTIPSSSPSKLEIDEEEVEFELTPSIIAQAKAIDIHVNLNCSNVNSPVKTQFISKPLIQPTAILTNCRRSIQHGNNPHFQTHIATPLSPNVLFACSKLPIIEATKLNAIMSVVPTVSNVDIVNSPSKPIITTDPSNNATVQAPVSNPKIKHRKWTHNFLTSNSINFREVLCSVAPKTVTVARTPFCQTSLAITNSRISSNSSMSIGCGTVSNKPSSSIPSVVVSSVVSPFKCTLSPVSVPSKGSSVVLKSLLVGSNSANDLCSLNKSPIWNSKYLATNSPSNSHDSKIKWQVGGSVVPNPPASVVVVTSVSKENKALYHPNNPPVSK